MFLVLPVLAVMATLPAEAEMLGPASSLAVKKPPHSKSSSAYSPGRLN
jgi:hypothetical protein